MNMNKYKFYGVIQAVTVKAESYEAAVTRLEDAGFDLELCWKVEEIDNSGAVLELAV